jgi:hypothetical protein
MAHWFYGAGSHQRPWETTKHPTKRPILLYIDQPLRPASDESEELIEHRAIALLGKSGVRAALVCEIPMESSANDDS